MDGGGSLFGTLSGNSKEILHTFSVDLPKKHGRGGQSAARFGRLRLEKRHNYIRKVSEFATQHFISNDLPNVKGLVLAGSGDFKNQLLLADFFDQRLKKVVIKVVDTSYGGENGFNQAIELAQEALINTKFIHEKKVIGKFFDHIARDTGEFCFGINETNNALEMGAVETLIIWEELPYLRCVMKNSSTGENKVVYLKKEQLVDEAHFKDENGDILEIQETQNYVEWLSEKRERRRGSRLELITDKSQDGSQFCVGFGGIGAILRWRIESEKIDVPDDEDDEWGSDF